MLYFSTFQLTWQSDTEDRAKGSGGSCNCSSVDNSVMVHETVKSDKRRLVYFTKNAKSPDTSRKSRKTTSTENFKGLSTYCRIKFTSILSRQAFMYCDRVKRVFTAHK